MLKAVDINLEFLSFYLNFPLNALNEILINRLGLHCIKRIWNIFPEIIDQMKGGHLKRQARLDGIKFKRRQLIEAQEDILIKKVLDSPPFLVVLHCAGNPKVFFIRD